MRELYAAYEQENPNDKVGFSKFCELRPKQCYLAGAGGTHAVCVCAIHQNFKLLLKATGTRISYRELIPKIVCNIEERDCMLRVCSSCPGE